MSKDFEALEAEAAELLELIGLCKAELNEQEETSLGEIVLEQVDVLGEVLDVLDTPLVSTAAKAFLISSAGASVVPVLGQAAAALGVAVVAGGTAIGLGKRAIAKHKAKEALLPYYEELSVKHALLLRRHRELEQELIALNKDEVERRQALMADFQRQQQALERIAASGLLNITEA